jgi:hypothetical protein
MTERDCLRHGEWKKVNYYPVSIEKLQRASMREAAYLIAPVNIGEDYEYFDEVKHLLIIPEKPKAIEELSQELNEKIDELLVKTQRKFAVSKQSAEYHYNKKFNGIIDNFEYAKEHGQFPLIFTLDYSNLSVTGDSYISSNFEIRSGGEQVGYYTIGNGYLRYFMNKKPNFINRFCMNKLLNFRWIDVK